MITIKKTEVVETLKKARELISSPEHWTKRAYARTVDRCITLPIYENAQCLCSVGALMRVTRAETSSHPLIMACQEHLTVRSGLPLIDWNDRHYRTHEEVLALFDLTIKELTDA